VRPAPAPRLLAAVALGGACGAVLRWWLGETFPDGTGFPWTVFTINVSGSLALAALPGVAVVRRSPALAVGLGTGVLGGFTTLSACSEQTRALLHAGNVALAAAYLLGTLAAALVAVWLGDRLSTADQRRGLDAVGADE
jgi:CrcB protein